MAKKKDTKPEKDIKYSELTDSELRDILTEKERIWCHEYIIDWNKARAARVAGYSENTCTEIGYQNFIKLHIKEYVNRIKNNLEIESGISKLRNLKRLAKIAYSSMADLNETWIDRKALEDVRKSNPDLLDCLSEISTKTQSFWDDHKKKDIEVEYVKIKMHDPQRAIEIINKMMGYNAIEKKSIDIGMGRNIISDLFPDDEELTNENNKSKP